MPVAVPVAVPAVVTVAVPAVVTVDVAAGAGSMTHRVRGECWVQQVSKVLTVAEVVAVAAVAGDECETAWFGTKSCVSGKSGAADLVRDFFARPGKVAA